LLSAYGDIYLLHRLDMLFYRSIAKAEECCHLLGFSAVWSVRESNFRSNISPPFSGSKISPERNCLVTGVQEMAIFITTAVRTSNPIAKVVSKVAYNPTSFSFTLYSN
jgi:hypothetical protein